MTSRIPFPSLSVCGLDEVPSIPAGRHSALLSIVDPDINEVFRPPAILPDRHLVMRFHDLIEPDDRMIAPSEADIAEILAFGNRIGSGENPGVLIHCHMGVSRSTAALAILLARNRPDQTHGIFHELLALRPQAWPNSRMIWLADKLLGLDGRLVRSLRGLYQRQIVQRPDVVEIILRYGRAAEVKWALYGGVSPADWKVETQTADGNVK